MSSSKPMVVLARPEYSYDVYRSAYKGHFAPGQKQVEPPMALMQIGAALVESGSEVRIIDGEAHNLNPDKLVDEIVQRHPDVVGMTCTTPEFPTVGRIIDTIKKISPTVVTVIGGSHATHLPWEIIDAGTTVDHVVVYEGEKAMVAIVNGDVRKIQEYAANAQALMTEAGVPNPAKYNSSILLGPSQSIEDLNRARPLRSLPYIDMSKYRYADPRMGLVVTDSVETARGCPFGCTFCSSAHSGLRLRSVDSVIDELSEVHASFVNHNRRGLVLLLDDTLTIDRSRSIELFERIVSFYPPMHYKIFTRADSVSTEANVGADLAFATLMKRAGISTVSLGVETGDPHINRAIRKGASLDDYRNACSILRQVGLAEVRGSFIIGHPYETQESIARSISFAKELRLHRVGVNIMTPYPGTLAYEAAQKGQGLYFEDEADDFSCYRRWGQSVVSTEELSSQALSYWHRRFLTEVYTDLNALKHSAEVLLMGNRSPYYHRPTYQAIIDRYRMALHKEWRPPPTFPNPNHDNYDTQRWKRSHITKALCVAFLQKKMQDSDDMVISS